MKKVEINCRKVRTQIEFSLWALVSYFAGALSEIVGDSLSQCYHTIRGFPIDFLVVEVTGSVTLSTFRELIHVGQIQCSMRQASRSAHTWVASAMQAGRCSAYSARG